MNNEQKNKVLIVDDDSGIREVLQKEISELGFNVQVAANGLHALTKIKSGFIPSLLITDIIMPGMNGPDLIKNIRSDGNQNIKEIPIIVMTAANDKSLVLDIARLGITNIVFKPVNNQDLVKKILIFFSKKDKSNAA
jgi:CheY-like chemotaxis protein